MTIWLWAVSAVAGSLLGAATTKWFKDTKAGLWCYDKFEDISNWAIERYGIDILSTEDISWRTKYPQVAERMDELEMRLEKLESKK